MSHANDLQSTIKQVACEAIDSQLQTTWLIRVFRPHPQFDGALALILCLASQLNYLDIVTSHHRSLTMTQDIIRALGCSPADPAEANHSFRKLHTIHVNGGSPPVILGIKELVISHACFLGGFSISKLSFPSTLTKLVLDNGAFKPEILERALCNPWFDKNELLHVITAANARGWPKDYNYSNLKQLLYENLPTLKNFVWKKTWKLSESAEHRIFGSFKSFTAMEVLRIDYDLFSGRYGKYGKSVDPTLRHLQTLPDLTTFEEFLPPNLQILEIHGLEWSASQYTYV
ncbi:hypothetical protein CC86DRAFT_413803 [Ophiobolus disseminans]|uniref:F-box domain-containing protein n=1 Tax=Ophiobolus disseminans TaxID=1469910 RepID=A0A6A6ZCI1_9PLEO|nr:hypothetical protein CC86DRAFT_413803 [Ophiobolus disseminans]